MTIWSNPFHIKIEMLIIDFRGHIKMTKEQLEYAFVGDVKEIESQLSNLIKVAHNGDIESYEKLLKIKEAIGSI